MHPSRVLSGYFHEAFSVAARAVFSADAIGTVEFERNEEPENRHEQNHAIDDMAFALAVRAHHSFADAVCPV